MAQTLDQLYYSANNLLYGTTIERQHMIGSSNIEASRPQPEELEEYLNRCGFSLDKAIQVIKPGNINGTSPELQNLRNGPVENVMNIWIRCRDPPHSIHVQIELVGGTAKC